MQQKAMDMFATFSKREELARRLSEQICQLQAKHHGKPQAVRPHVP